MSQGLDYDEEASRRLEAMYVTPDVVGQRSAILQSVGLLAGERVLDVGSGPGFLAAEIAEVVGPSGTVHGVDISECMVEMARKRCMNFPSIDVEVGDAHALNLNNDMFDVAISTQVLEYVTDPSKVLEEIHRVVRPGGRFAILATDWGSMVWHSSDDKLMERVLIAWRNHCSDPHLPRTLGPRILDVGFEITTRSIIPLYNATSHNSTYSGGLIDLIASFVPSASDLTVAELDTWATGLRALSERGDYFFSLNRYLFVGSKPN